MMLADAELLIHMLKKAVTPISPAILLMKVSNHADGSAKKHYNLPYDGRTNVSQYEQCQSAMQTDMLHRIGQDHDANKHGCDVLRTPRYARIALMGDAVPTLK